MVQAARRRVFQVGRGMIGGLILAAAALVLAGCSGLVEDKPKVVQVNIPVPPSAPKTTGIESPAAREHRELVAYFGGEYRAPATERYLDEILAKLAPASDTPGQTYKITILNSPVVNAFALPSGNIYVTRGLLALADDTSEVAAVMAHEIAHVTARHALQRAELEKRSAVISRAADVIDNPQKGKTFKTYAQLTLASFSRQQEFEADQIGIRVIAKAGYDPFAASRFLVSLGRSTDLRQATHPNANGGKPDMMATHPSTPERVAHAVAIARGIGAPGIGEVGHDRYLAAIEGTLYGDDPVEGFVRGRTFIHPKLGFAFTAPESFVLENSAQAVLGVTEDGSEALRLDRVHVAADMTLQAYLNSGWIDGLQPSSAQVIVVNGLPAITAIGKAESWTFRLAAIRVGPEVYRLTFAAHDLTPSVDADFRTAIDTFRRITPEEVRAIKPMRLAVVTAAPDDTVDSLSARMAVPDHPLETFKVLNGMDGSSIVPGQRYKLVVE